MTIPLFSAWALWLCSQRTSFYKHAPIVKYVIEGLSNVYIEKIWYQAFTSFLRPSQARNLIVEYAKTVINGDGIHSTVKMGGNKGSYKGARGSEGPAK